MSTVSTYATFKCAARSKNRVPAGDPNGRRGCLTVAENGVTFEVSKRGDQAPKLGDSVNVEKKLNEYRWFVHGFVTAVQLPNAGPEVVDLVWKKESMILTSSSIIKPSSIVV